MGPSLLQATTEFWNGLQILVDGRLTYLGVLMPKNMAFDNDSLRKLAAGTTFGKNGNEGLKLHIRALRYTL